MELPLRKAIKAIPRTLQLLLIFGPLEQTSDVMFLELWGKVSKNFKGFYLNKDYWAGFCGSQVLGQLSSSSVVLAVKWIVSDISKSDLLISY